MQIRDPGLRAHETRHEGLGEDKNNQGGGVGFPWILWVDLRRSCVAIRDLDPPAVATLRLTRPWLIWGRKGQTLSLQSLTPKFPEAPKKITVHIVTRT